jgi:resolvase-like protein
VDPRVGDGGLLCRVRPSLLDNRFVKVETSRWSPSRIAESLDRLSRDQEDTAGLFKIMTFAGVRIVIVSEGDIGHLQVGLKGTMNALYLTDLAEKTHRGLRGRVEAGRSGGGLCYGYRVVRVPEGQPRGEREVHSGEAAVVQRVISSPGSRAAPNAGVDSPSHDRLVCFNARSRGTCDNDHSIKRQEVETRVLRAMRERFFEPGAFAAFCEGFTAEMEARRREHVAQRAGTRRELAAVERRQREIMNALAEGPSSKA